MEINTQDVYRIVFREYPDVLNIKQVSEILGVSTKTVYKMVKDGSLQSLKIGREFRIPKVMLLKDLKVLGNSASEKVL